MAEFTQQRRGEEAEDRACAFLQAQGLRLVQRNYRVARGPRARAAEIDVIAQTPGGTLVFVEVRSRASAQAGGAAASVDPRKQARIVWGARHFLLRLREIPPCRFDVVAIDGERLAWIRGAFDLSLGGR